MIFWLLLHLLIHTTNKNLVRGIPKLSGQPNLFVVSAWRVNKWKVLTKKKSNEINTTRILDLLHMDLMSPMRTKMREKICLGHSWWFFKYSFVCFLREKYNTIEHLKSLCTRIQVEIGHQIVRIRNDKGIKFDNVDVNLLCDSKGIKHENSALRTAQ